MKKLSNNEVSVVSGGKKENWYPFVCSMNLSLMSISGSIGTGVALLTGLPLIPTATAGIIISQIGAFALICYECREE